jgi:NADH-quinone oxidoreductase subunit G
VRFTREVSKSHALGVLERGDHSVIRPAGGAAARPLEDDAYSDNIVDLCPVGALLSRQFLYKDRVWYLKATPSVCPGCERGCNVDLWHRKPEWALRSLDAKHNTAIARVTPRENPAVNGPWVCNKARDLASILERPRALVPMSRGRELTLEAALASARALIGKARRAVALVSSWGSDEELQAFARALGGRFTSFVKTDHRPAAGEVVEDDLLIRADKNPNGHGARALFGSAPAAFAPDTDLVLVWGEGADFAALPRGVPVILLNAFLAPENGHAEVFFPISLMTERRGHYTNFQGIRSAFEACFAPPPGVVHAEWVFEALAVQEVVTP